MIATSDQSDISRFGTIQLLLQPTFLNLVPPLVSFLSTNPAVKSQHLSTLHSVTGGAAPFGPALIEEFMEKAAPTIIKFREGEYLGFDCW